MTINKIDKNTCSKARKSRDPRFDGMFFIAVKTTGIFCRPICPANLPKEENVRYYALAASAMADGYRPCLRCRPDSAPRSHAWNGIQTTVTRGLSMLDELPPQKVANIATRLGISERYFNKLITSSISLSPKQYQMMQQALFAKQLLQQSNASVIDVALAAGYASARQLQRAMQTFCKMPPSKLRGSVKHLNTSAITLHLPFRPPYHWDYVRDFLAVRAVKGVEAVTANSYSRNCNIHGEIAQFTATYNAKANGFDVSITMANLKYLYLLVEQIKVMLDVNAQPELISASLHKAGLAETEVTQGLRLPTTFSLFEAGCRAIIGQQISVKAAMEQVTLFTETLGKTDEKGKVKSYAFPTPEDVIGRSLAFLKMPQLRKQAISDFAALCARNPRPLYDEILAIKGIGEWTVSYIKMRGNGDPDTYLNGDLIVNKAALLFGTDEAEAAPWRSYLTLQLWHLYNQLKVA